MKNKPHFLLLILVLSLAALYWQIRTHGIDPAPDSPQTESAKGSPNDMRKPRPRLGRPPGPLLIRGVPELPSEPPRFHERELHHARFPVTPSPDLPEWFDEPQEWVPPDLDLGFLKRLEGSYGTDDLLEDDRDISFFLPVDTGWFWDHPNAPQVGMQFWKDPDTGQYEPVGGRIAFPSGFGILHEYDANSAEQRTFLKFKKTF